MCTLWQGLQSFCCKPRKIVPTELNESEQLDGRSFTVVGNGDELFAAYTGSSR